MPNQYARIIVIPMPGGPPEFTVGGADAVDLFYMVADALDYCGGPGLPGFTDYLNAKVRAHFGDGPCLCGGTDHDHTRHVQNKVGVAARIIRQMLESLPK